MLEFSDPFGFFVGLFFVGFAIWNLLLGEIAHRLGTIRFDEHPWLCSSANSLFFTLGFLACAFSIKTGSGFKLLIWLHSINDPAYLWGTVYAVSVCLLFIAGNLMQRMRYS